MPAYLSPGVYIEEAEAGSRPIEGVGTAVAAFVGLAERGPANQPTLVSNWRQFTTLFGEFVEGSYLAHSVYGFFMNGGGNCYVVRIGADSANGKAAGNGKSSRAGGKELTGGPQATLGSYRIVALESGGRSGDVSVEIADPGGESPPEGSFKLVVKIGGKAVEEFDRLTTAGGDKQNAVTVVNAQSKAIRLELETTSGTLERPQKGTVRLAPPPPAPVDTTLRPDDYVGDVSDRTGFGGLEAIDEVTMVAAPDLMAAYQRGVIDDEGLNAVQKAMITHCELMGDRVAILDPPPDRNPQQIKQWLADSGYDSPYATLYWPWIKVFDPTSGTGMFVPPSGHVAGIWGRNDDTRGVHKAPANEVVRGAITLETQITRNEHDLLNPVGINCLRAFPGRGIRVWGARTLASTKTEWRYLNVRRLFNYLEESILDGTTWVVFEPNDDALWAKIRRTIAAFLVMEWRKGALFGLTPDEAFYVKCDRETNPAEAIDAGQVLCEIGVAPVKPAEFVVFRLSQLSGGTSLVSE